MARAFTALFVTNVKPTDKRREIPDPGCRGLHLIVQPSGVKSWAVRYRTAGRAVKLTLGPDSIPLAEARQMAADAMAKVARGIDPQLEKKAAARAVQQQQDSERNTFRAVAEMYMKLEGDKLRRADQKHATLTRLVYPALGNRPIETIKRSDVVALLDRISAGEFARDGQPSPIMSNRTRAAISSVFSWYANRSDDFRSPIAGMKALNKENTRARVLTDDEIRKIWQACEAAPSSFNRLVQFLLVTAARRTEGSALTWGEINGVWTLPAERNKTGEELTRPLNKRALTILDNMPRLVECDLVFPAATNTPLVSYNYHKRLLDEASGVTGWVLHDLRRTARTLMSRAGIDVDTSERMLGHTIGGVRGVYDRHKYLPAMTRGFDALSGLLDQILDPQDNVTPFRVRA